MLKEDILNIVLLLPLGGLLPFVFDKKIRWWQGLLCGIVVSLGIEILQLVLKRGLFEFDDIMNNSIGCMLGCSIWKFSGLSVSGKTKYGIETDRKEFERFMKKVLFAINTLNNGGAEKVLLTLLRYLDPKKV